MKKFAQDFIENMTLEAYIEASQNFLMVNQISGGGKTYSLGFVAGKPAIQISCNGSKTIEKFPTEKEAMDAYIELIEKNF